MTNYGAGTRFEHRVRNHLRGAGWAVVRSAGSKTPVDLVALGHGQVLLVQCKYGPGLLEADWNELRRLASISGARPVLATAEPRRALQYFMLLGPKKKHARWVNQPVELFDPNVHNQER